MAEKVGQRRRRKLIKGYDKRMDRKWIAAVSFAGDAVITFGKDPVKVLKRVKERGYENPVIFFRPKDTDVLVGGMYYERGADGLLKPIGQK